jgi:hypothetical protein
VREIGNELLFDSVDLWLKFSVVSLAA